MRNIRSGIWGAAIVVGGVLFALDTADVFPEWLVVGPVVLGVAGVALLADQIFWAPGRKGGFFGSLLMIALSAATVTQDAGLVIDEWSVWPFLAGAVVFGVPLEILATHRRRTERRSGPPLRAKAA